MVFYIIGLGLGDHRDITVKGLDVYKLYYINRLLEHVKKYI